MIIVGTREIIMKDKISSEDFIKAFGGGVKHKMINISKEEIRDKMFFVREEDSDQPIAVVKVADLMKNDRDKESGKRNAKMTDHKCFTLRRNKTTCDVCGAYLSAVDQ